MLYQKPTFTLPSSPGADKLTCCEACVYGRGEHAAWCGLRARPAEATESRRGLPDRCPSCGAASVVHWSPIGGAAESWQCLVCDRGGPR